MIKYDSINKYSREIKNGLKELDFSSNLCITLKSFTLVTKNIELKNKLLNLIGVVSYWKKRNSMELSMTNKKDGAELPN